MKRINSSGCGYSYNRIDRLKCNSIKPLHPYFASTGIDSININVTEPEWVEFDGSTATQKTLDNYGQIPQSFEGFIMTLAPVIDMSGGTTGYPAEVPEIECRVNMDPFTDGESVLNYDPSNPREYTDNPETVNTGFLDLFTYVSDYHTAVYASVNGNTTYLGNKIPVMVDNSTAKNPYMVKPGILEPMLDTQLPNIDVKTIPAVDAGLDGAFLALDRLQQWRSVIDARITNLTYAVEDPNIFPQDSPCDNFKIELRAGTVYQPGVIVGGTEATITYPLYTVADGTVSINGTTVAVTGTTYMPNAATAASSVVIEGHTVECAIAPFAAYLKVSSDTNGIAANKMVYHASTAPELSAAYNLYYIGGVSEATEVVATGGTTSKVNALFQIDQGDCIEDIEYITGKSTGYVYMNVTAGGRQYTTDTLLDWDVFENDVTGTTNAIRGVQAEAIQKYVLAHGGTTGNTDWVGYPNYAAYGADTGDVPPDYAIFGTAWLLPVKKDTAVVFQTGASDAYCRVTYAPSVGSATTTVTGTTALTKDNAFSVLENGWVRLRVFDDGTQKGQCLRFGEVVGGVVSWDNLTPVYRFGDFSKFDNSYRGPFLFSGGTICCPVCPEGIGGYYRFGGQQRRSVQTMGVTLTGATNDIYLHITGTGQDNYDIDTLEGSTAANAYTVWIAHVEGAQTTTAGGPYVGGTVTQIQHGDVYVDGRWM